MTNARRILQALDARLDSRVELTLYGRAALLLGFGNAPHEYALSQDVDAVLWIGQAEELNERTDFWQAVEAVNQELSADSLFISHFFTEDQVVLLPSWRRNRVRLLGDWRQLELHRLGNLDLLLSKLMRDDPIDQDDAVFIAREGRLAKADIERAIREARVPEAEEVVDQFRSASARLLGRI